MAKKQNKGNPFNGSYLGLDPSKFALANYHCPSCNTAFSSNKGIVIMCPTCGTNAGKQKGLVSASTVEAFKIATCKVCSSDLYTDLEPEEVVENVNDFYCPECGSETVSNDDLVDMEESYDEDEDVADIETEIVDEDEDFEEGLAGDDEDLEDDEDEDDLEDDDEDDDDEDDEDLDDEDLDEEDELVETEVVDESEIEDAEWDEDEDMEEDLEEEEAESMSKEIASILASPLKDRESIAMDVWHMDDDVVRNVIISGMPVARICLSDQENPAELEEVFDQDVYEESIVDSMTVKPIGEVLEESRARVIRAMKESGVIPRSKEVEASVTAQINAFRSRFKETFLTVLSGANKNLFPDVANSLKNSLWEAMAAEGLESPESIIEPAFEEGAEEFVDQVFDKTMDLLEKGEEVRQEILKMVDDSGTKAVKSSTTNVDSTLASQLTRNAMPIRIGATSSSMRDDLRSRLNLRNR
jgi:predicted RNA-binding Zn-ribbon protein involved in translation (DUF1610 family)